MSASSPSLKNPILIGMLVLGGIAVTILNIQTFGSGARPSRRVQNSGLNQPALPPDLAILVQAAMSEGSGQAGAKAAPPRVLPTLTRDPFQGPPTRSATRSTTAAPAARPKGELVCSAVMTGGKRPSAMLNGKFYTPGDKVQGYTLAWIASNGVTLENSGGAKKFIPLTNKSRQTGALTVKLGQKPSTDNP